MKVPYSIQCAVFAPVFIGLILLLKISCPVATGDGCFADNFTMPIFMPVAFVYKVFGDVPFVSGHDLLFLLSYWTVVGLFLGLTLDLYKGQSRYSPE